MLEEYLKSLNIEPEKIPELAESISIPPEELKKDGRKTLSCSPGHTVP